MPRYLIALHHHETYDPAVAEDAIVHKAIDDLNDAMVAAGVRVFVGGLHSYLQAKSLRRQTDGGIITTDGPYLETKEHIAGFWVLECENLEEAMEWGRKAVLACRNSVEVREFGGSHCP